MDMYHEYKSVYVSGPNAFELDFSGLLSNRGWIGLVRGSDDSFKWVSGAAPSYSNWNTGKTLICYLCFTLVCVCPSQVYRDVSSCIVLLITPKHTR